MFNFFRKVFGKKTAVVVEQVKPVSHENRRNVPAQRNSDNVGGRSFSSSRDDYTPTSIASADNSSFYFGGTSCGSESSSSSSSSCDCSSSSCD